MLSSNQKQLVLLLIGLTSGIGLGLLISFVLFAPNQASERWSANDSTLRPALTNGLSTGDVASVERDIADIIELESALDRRSALYRLLEGKRTTEISELLSLTLKLERTQNLYAVQHLLFVELALLDPRKSVELVWETERVRWETLFDLVASYSSSVDPEEALRVFSTLSEPWKGRLISVVFQNQQRLTEAELAAIAEALDITDAYNTWITEIKLNEVIDKPRVAFDLVLTADIPDFQKKKFLSRVTSRWIERDGTGSISSMLSLVYEEFADKKSTYWRTVVSEIAATDPHIAWEQLTSLSVEVQRLFNDVIFEAWVEKDPSAAIQAITSHEYLNSMMSDFSSMLEPWIQAVSDEILEHIDLVPPDFQIFAIRFAINHLAQHVPPEEVIELLAQFRQRGFNTLQATDAFVRIWSQKDPLSAIDWVVHNLEKGTSNGQPMLWITMPQVALVDPQKAMEIALEHPVENNLEFSVFSGLLGEERIESALSLLPQVRDSYMNEPIFGSIANSLVEVGRIEDALAIAERLGESQKPRFYVWMVIPWLHDDLDSLFEYLPKLESAEIRSIVASTILDAPDRLVNLSEKEEEFVQSFISDDTDQP